MAPAGFTVNKYAGDLSHPRWLYAAKNGDVFVAESNTVLKGIMKLGAGISKITVVGKQPLNISAQYYHNVERPDDAGADQVRLVVAFLFPRGM